MLLPSKFTCTSCTPATLRTAFSTCALQAEQVMPVTSNAFFVIFLSPFVGF